MMINVTEKAAQQLRSLLQSQQEAKHKGLRVQIAKGGCSGLQYEMLLDERKDGDAIVERDGVEFFIDAESGAMLTGATLDFNDDLTGTGFRIVNPNATRTCGCGTSSKQRAPLRIRRKDGAKMDRDLFVSTSVIIVRVARRITSRGRSPYFCLSVRVSAWLGSFYIFGQPERPDSYRI